MSRAGETEKERRPGEDDKTESRGQREKGLGIRNGAGEETEQEAVRATRARTLASLQRAADAAKREELWAEEERQKRALRVEEQRQRRERTVDRRVTDNKWKYQKYSRERQYFTEPPVPPKPRARRNHWDAGPPPADIDAAQDAGTNTYTHPPGDGRPTHTSHTHTRRKLGKRQRGPYTR